MTKNRIPKPPTESTSSTQRSSLWKRIGRRGSSTPSQPSSPPGAAIPLTSTSKGGVKGGLFRKLKGSLRNTPINSSSGGNQPVNEVDDANFVMTTGHQRYATSSRPSSPAYSIDSYVTTEVGRENTFCAFPIIPLQRLSMCMILILSYAHLTLNLLREFSLT